MRPGSTLEAHAPRRAPEFRHSKWPVRPSWRLRRGAAKPGRTPGGGGPLRAPLVKGHRIPRSTLAARARLMRADPTPSEARLWRALRGAQLGVVFRRQVVVGAFIVDFAAPHAHLVVEVDGGYHVG